MNKKKFIKDSMLNIISTAFPLLVLQLVSLPVAASQLGAIDYGLVISIISILTVLGFPMGNVLNNIRLLKNESYMKEELSGDFNYILVSNSLITCVVMFIFALFFIETIEFYNILLMVLIVFFSIFKEYLVVSYRLTLNFKGILLNNIFLSFGYLFGTGLFYLTNVWEYIYLAGLIFSLVYIVFTSKLLFEPYTKTKFFNHTLKEFGILYGSGLLKNFLSYADKIILLPLLGAKNVSIYYAASVLGKIVIMLFNPINSVILSYIVKVDTLNKKVFLKAFFMVGLIGIIGYIVTVVISPYFLQSFYSEWANESLKLIYVTSATATIAVLTSVFHPFNLRFNSLKWQVYMSGYNLLFFFLVAYFLTKYYGLMGFTIAVLMSGLFRFVFQLFIYFKNHNE